jgi:hypothetical protein
VDNEKWLLSRLSVDAPPSSDGSVPSAARWVRSAGVEAVAGDVTVVP